ncbi:MAG: AsnC family protein [Rhodospirillales bacterium]
MRVSEPDRRLLAAIEEGLPLVSRPYRDVGRRVGLEEDEVIARLAALIEAGVVKRLGLVVRHRELGYVANAMVVWDVGDDAVGAVGRRLAAFPFVTLCYRRPRRPPRWPYNLFCMIHGRDRETVLAQVDTLRREAELTDTPHVVLFSRTRFKQRGARYGAALAAETV